MEGTNQLLQDQFYKIVQRTMGVHDSDADKNSLLKVWHISLAAGAMDTSRLSSNSSNPLPPSSNTSNPNPPLSADENTSLITVLTQVRKYLNHRA